MTRQAEADALKTDTHATLGAAVEAGAAH
jgi:hypothetical protein